MSLPESICKLKIFEDWWMEEGRWKHPTIYERLLKVYQIYRFPKEINGEYFVPRQDLTAKEIGLKSTVALRFYLRILIYAELIYPYKMVYGGTEKQEWSRIEFRRN